MNRARFIHGLEGTGQIRSGDLQELLTSHVIERWLQDNHWVVSRASLCRWCEHLSWFSEEKCVENVRRGGSCYRETLKAVFILFLRNALRGRYPSPESVLEVVHREGPIYDGIGNFSIIQMILHELGSTLMKMDRGAYEKSKE